MKETKDNTDARKRQTQHKMPYTNKTGQALYKSVQAAPAIQLGIRNASLKSIIIKSHFAISVTPFHTMSAITLCNTIPVL